MVKTVNQRKRVTDRKAAALNGRPLDYRHHDEALGGGDWDVYADRGWPPILIVRRQAVPSIFTGRSARAALRSAAKESNNRGGRRSGTVGFIDGRACAFNRDDPGGWRHVLRILQALDAIYREAAPFSYADQWAFARLTSPGLVIPGTVFTTGTVNDTVVWPAHRDRGNLSFGLSVMAVLRSGSYEGCLFVLPQYRLAVDLGDRDVVLFESRAWHGNTPFVGGARGYERLSVVAYDHWRMLRHGTADGEHERADRLS